MKLFISGILLFDFEKEAVMKKFIILFVVMFVANFEKVSAQDSLSSSFSSKKSDNSPKPGVSMQRAWSIFSPMDLELGYGGQSDVGYGKGDPGFVGTLTLFRIAYGFSSLNNLGIGTALLEGTFASPNGQENWSVKGLPSSFFPIYVYYPLFSYDRRFDDAKGTKVKSPFIYLFAGGSAWNDSNSYVHLGIRATLLTWNMEEMPHPINATLADLIVMMLYEAVPRMNFGVQAGIIYTSSYKVNNVYNWDYENNYFENKQEVGGNFGFYMSFTCGIGAAH